ncbi:MAG: hypothetical protein ACW986_03665 [Promethearchaeota archaeon]|jgi:hypothetical protein
MKPKFHCPRCKSSDILEFDKFISCPKCALDFNKEDVGNIPDDQIVARQEMGGLFDAFDELKDPKRNKEIFDSIMKDLEDLDNDS